QGPSTRPLIFYSALVGGTLLLWSDVLARTILPQGAELPVGVVTALFGGPVFCLILAKKNTHD
ncbi:MAG: iron ABC transporter permease, partial [Desulfovibrionales bacterium]|nr:iron ABC transporter permease [Desulfovibrionales bacterium]